MLLPIVLISIPYLVGGCIPVKTPSPGIPAVKSCKLFVEDVPGCNVKWTGVCERPDPLTTTSITCPAASPFIFLFPAGAATDGKIYTKAVCDPVTGQWMVTNFEGTVTAPSQFTNIGCIPT